MDNDVTAAGETALRAVDAVLADKPDKVGHDFSAAEHAMAAYRDALIGVWRESRSEQDLQRLMGANSVLSVVVGGHFPLGGVPWPHLQNARESLAGLVGRTATRGDPTRSRGTRTRRGRTMQQTHTEQTIQHTDDQQDTGTHKKPGAIDEKGADRFGGTRAGKENVEPRERGDKETRDQ